MSANSSAAPLFDLSSIAERPQRQDASSDQLYDVIVLAGRLGYEELHTELLSRYGSRVVRSLFAAACDFSDIPQQQRRSDLSLERQLLQLRVAANLIGCYDAADSLGYFELR